jgi:hypothetical protein
MRAAAFTQALGVFRHQRIAPYTPRHNGKVESYNRSSRKNFSMLAGGIEKKSAQQRSARGICIITTLVRTPERTVNHPLRLYPCASTTLWHRTTSRVS